MSTSPMKKNTLSEHDTSPHESRFEPDFVTQKKLLGIIFGMSAIICAFLFAEANRTGLWREMIVSAAQVVVTALALCVMLPRRA